MPRRLCQLGQTRDQRNPPSMRQELPGAAGGVDTKRSLDTNRWRAIRSPFAEHARSSKLTR